MRVLQLGTDPLTTTRQPHGAIFELDQARALALRGHQVRMVSTGVIPRRYLGRPYPYPRLTVEENLEVHRKYTRFLLPLRREPVARDKVILDAVNTACRVIDGGFHPEIIHGHNLGGGLAAASISHEMGVPFVVTEHRTSWLKPWHSAQLAEVWRRSLLDVAGVACVGEALRRSFEAHLPELDGRVRVIPNLVDDRFFDNAAHRPSTGATRFLMLGYLRPHKGHHRAIEAFARVHGRDRNASLTIVGNGPERARLVRLSRELGVANRIEWLGTLPRESIVRVLRESTCLVVASDVETFSVAAIEALASGVPVIATRSGGPEFFVRESDGVIARDLSVDALAEALIEFRAHRSRFDSNQISESCRARFGREAVTKQIEEMWGEALDGH